MPNRKPPPDLKGEGNTPMKINFEMLAYSSETLGWTKTVALVRHGLEADIISETECQLALAKLKEMFNHYNWFEIQQGHAWHVQFNETAFDLTKPFDLERETVNDEGLVAYHTKNIQACESVGEQTSVQYPVLGDFESDCIMQHAEAI